jgi:hypothetical protein
MRLNKSLKKKCSVDDNEEGSSRQRPSGSHDNEKFNYADPRVDLIFKILFYLEKHLWIQHFFMNCILSLDELNCGKNPIINLPIGEIRDIPKE